MATPTRPPAVSTPRPLTSTPHRPTASPRTNLGAFANKTIAGKSPAVKTPASTHNHAHRSSISSHPTSTALASSALQEDILNMNTPSALLASMGTIGLTPLPVTQDGLGIVPGSTALSTLQDGHTSRNPERERYERLKTVAELLKRKTAGRGISREHIQRLAKIHGFDEGLDENSLTIAGQKFVELEINFDAVEQNKVDKVSLKLNGPDQDEGIYQDGASQVLSVNLKPQLDSKVPWHDLVDFSANLGYLSRLEHADTSGNCFQVIDNLYDVFQRIWIEEKKRMKWRHDCHHFCQSNVGEPQKDVRGRLGLNTVYWSRGRRFFSCQELDTDEHVDSDTWKATFAVESGSPSIPAIQQWLADDVLTNTARAEDIFQESTIDKPSWQDPNLPTQPKTAQSKDAMDVDQPKAEVQEELNMHFTCQLEPEIFLPLQQAQALNERSYLIDLHQNLLVTVQQLVLGHTTTPTDKRWLRTQHTFSKSGEHKEQKYSYMLYAANQAWLHPVSKLKFAHPQQYAEALPILRQYALVNTLLQSIKPEPSAQTSEQSPSDSTTTTTHKTTPARGKITKRSNKPALNAQIDALLGHNLTDSQQQQSPLPIDLRIDPLSTSAKPSSSSSSSCRLQISLPLSTRVLSRTTGQRLKAKAFLAIQIEILLNGVVEVVSLDGIELEKEQGEDLKKRLARVVRASEDVGTVVAWTVRELEGGSS
ncbi:hypothetical protein LTR05_008166 [Lithohypha guttulata]|uniref:Mediator of RNA polymerase II transcription subunit 1 n=1 Tax=Lithohypha guttulata TaxID=1690604 RepID=A0AAN7SU26_9EURO|nr:hypothetical protein LTR05_008166 [Lithohypha guttulata]